MGNRTATFKQRLTDGEGIIGTFLKTPSSIMAEVMGNSELDVIAIDAEHHPFGRLELDSCIAALRAADMPSLVRLSSDSPSDIRNALDCGATGIVAPHVTTASQAAAIVRAAHFGDGGRGYAGSTRAAGYGGKKMPDHLRDSAEQTTVIVQIEDIAALDNVDAIAAVEGVDCLFIGRVDLAVGMQKEVGDDKVLAAVQAVCSMGQKANTRVGMFTANYDELPDWRERGASLFLLSSDHALAVDGANQLATLIR
jgi:2-keto-3-deoxy-L-rhamnonate aldolase RhmA